MSEFEHNPRRRRRRRRSRASRWARALWPALPLVAAMLLSVGVIEVVESGPVPTPGREPVAQVPASYKASEHLDAELFKQDVFWDHSRLRRVSQEQRAGITLEPTRLPGDPAASRPRTAASALPGSFLGENVEALGVSDPSLLELSNPTASTPGAELRGSALNDLQ